MNSLIPSSSPVLRRPSPRWSCRVAATTLVLLVALLLQGCALLGKADMISTRYFEPEVPHAGSGQEPATTTAGAPLELILGRATSNPYLKSRLVYRTSNVEVGTYEDRQWTERPEEYARRAMAHALFDAQGITQVLSGESPTLEVDLTAFEEIRDADVSTGRVTIRYMLRDETSVWISDSITVDRPTKGGSQDPEAVVAALSTALTQAASEIAETVTARLRKEQTSSQSTDAQEAPPCVPPAEKTANLPAR